MGQLHDGCAEEHKPRSERKVEPSGCRNVSMLYHQGKFGGLTISRFQGAAVDATTWRPAVFCLALRRIGARTKITFDAFLSRRLLAGDNEALRFLQHWC